VTRDRERSEHKWACLLGQPVAHSLSPLLHNAAFAAAGLDAHYEARLVAPSGLPAAVDALRVPECLGANVTAPHKQAMLALVDELSDEARTLGAVNTVINQNGRLIGANTDAAGLARWMRRSGIDPTGRPSLVLGAGGAARSAVWALADTGATDVVVLNRTVERAQTVVAELRTRLVGVELRWGGLHEAEAGAPGGPPYGVVINATSMAYFGTAPRVHHDWYSRDSTAIELAYSPPETRFMAEARAAGARAENGLGMLVHQAALAFERWTGQAAPMAAYEAAVRERLAA
jgi:shikimate dehydrogenase